MEENSYISLTNWSSISDSWRFRQKAEMQLPNTARLSVGFKLERKDLTKAYDIPGYWDAFQEPAPQLLWGGWSGRLANPDLDPEEVRNYEIIGML
jgi:hypothetical protein